MVFTLLNPLNILLLLVGFCNSQKLIQLSSLNGANALNSIFDGNGTISIYVSAATDSAEYLKRLTFSSSESGVMSAYSLTQNRKETNSDLISPWTAKGITVLTTDLTTDQLLQLRGVLYCTTEKQALDSHFLVYDISQSQDISIKAEVNSTVVLLNSRFTEGFAYSTTISEWSQDASTSVHLYQGVPTDDVEIPFSFVFSNPVYTAKNAVFIPNVNDFSLTASPFYLKVSGNGLFTFKISAKYYDIDQTKTKAATSTGFYMKSTSQIDRTVLVNVASDSDFNGTVGANSISQLAENGKVSIDAFDQTKHAGVIFPNSNQILGWESDFSASTLKISSENPGLGKFFVQYYVIQGSRIATSPTTFAPLTLTTNGPAGGKLFSIGCILFNFC